MHHTNLPKLSQEKHHSFFCPHVFGPAFTTDLLFGFTDKFYLFLDISTKIMAVFD